MTCTKTTDSNGNVGISCTRNAPAAPLDAAGIARRDAFLTMLDAAAEAAGLTRHAETLPTLEDRITRQRFYLNRDPSGRGLFVTTGYDYRINLDAVHATAQDASDWMARTTGHPFFVR